MNVVQLVDRLAHGGVPKVVLSTQKALEQAGISSQIVCYYDDILPLYKEEFRANISVLPSGNALQKLIALRQLLDKLKPAVLHDHFGGLFSIGFLWGNAAKTIYHKHNQTRKIKGDRDRQPGWKSRFFERYLLPRYQHIIVLNQTEVADLKPRRLPALCLPNCIPYDAPKPSSEPKTTLSQPLRIGTIGRMVYEKGQLDGLDILAALRAKNIDATLRLSGPAEAQFLAQLRQRTHALKLQNHVLFEARQTGAQAFFQQTDLFLFTSKQEPFGLTILEAWQYGIPIVALQPEIPGGPNDLLRHGQNAMFVERNPEQAAQSIRELLDKPSLVEKITQGGRQEVRQYDLHHYAQKLQALYQA